MYLTLILPVYFIEQIETKDMLPDRDLIAVVKFVRFDPDPIDHAPVSRT
jgi:hypothetical protein